ncbi:MAG: hypothetical protein HRT83_01135 [Hyphomicrobiaceae bacterium]|nr:hypothetical protein [Hyphomicrobiaceae bacterium]
MSVRSIPLLVFVFLAYNLIVLFAGGVKPYEVLEFKVLIVPMMTGFWELTTGDLLVLSLFVLMFFELLKSTYTSSISLLDHALSMILFVICLVEFLLLPQAHTSVFFFVVVGSLIDVIAGYTIGIRVARRDFTIGNNP